MSTIDLSPQAGHAGGNATVDGTVRITGVDDTWATIRALTSGSGVDTDSGNWYLARCQGSGNAGKYAILTRTFHHYDLSALAGATITAAVFKFYPVSRTDGLAIGALDSSKIVLCEGTVSSNNDLAIGDFDNWGTVDFGRSAQQNSLTDNAYNDITLTAAGITYLNTKIGSIAKLCARFAFDFDNDVSTLPGGGTVGNQEIQAHFADQADATIPYLRITYTPAGPTNYTMAVLAGAFTLTGINVGLSVGKTMSVAVGSFILTGIAIVMSKTGWTFGAKHNSATVKGTKHSTSVTKGTKHSSTWVTKNKH
jgi:hypothetical protein